MEKSKLQYLLAIGLHDWLYRNDNLYGYPYAIRDISVLQQIECKNNTLKLHFKHVETLNIKTKADYKTYIKKLRKDLKDEFDIWPDKYDKYLNTHSVCIIDTMIYKLTDKQIDIIYGLLRIEGCLSNQDEEQAFSFILNTPE